MARNTIQFSMSFMICSDTLHQPITMAHLSSLPITYKLMSFVTPYGFHSSYECLQVQKDDEHVRICSRLKLNLIGWQVTKQLHSDSQEISSPLLSLKIHCLVQKNPQLDHIPSLMNPVHVAITYSFTINFNTMLPSTPRFPKMSFLSYLPPKVLYVFHTLSMYAAGAAKLVLRDFISVVILGRSRDSSVGIRYRRATGWMVGVEFPVWARFFSPP
jgi:hypothetical protein